MTKQVEKINETTYYVIGFDPASPDGDCTVKGFYKDGIFHIQEVIKARIKRAEDK